MTKLDAARRQLDTAIRLYLDGGDLSAVHTLTWAALTILRDLAAHSGIEHCSTFAQLDMPIDREAANFLKHADRDQKASLMEIEAFVPEFLMREAVSLYRSLSGEITPEMSVALRLSDVKYGLHPDWWDYSDEHCEHLRELERCIENACDEEEREAAEDEFRREKEARQTGLLMFGQYLLKS